MDKLLLRLILLLLVSSISSEIYAQQLTYGIRGGMNIARITETEFDYDSRVSIMAGGYINYRFPNSQFSIQPEMLYTQKGFKDSEMVIELDYIEFPILAKYSFNPHHPVNPSVFFGPYFGFMVNAETDDAPGGNFSHNIEDSVDDSPQMGLTAGGGININQFYIGVRYSAGLTNLTIEPRIFLSPESRQRTLSIITGFSF